MSKAIINNVEVEIRSTVTSIGGVGFKVSGISIQDAVEQFASATELTFAEDETVYGIYKNLTFASATVDAEGDVTVKFTIKSDIEADIAELKQTVSEQDELLAEILYGGESVEKILEEQGEEVNE